MLLVFAGFGSTCDWTQPEAPPAQADWNMFEAVVQRVRSGEPYYAAFTTELRSRGYPSDRVFNWRLPVLTLLLAALPDMQYARGIVVGLIGATLALWGGALGRVHGWTYAVSGTILLAIVLFPITIPSVIFFAESWAGLLIVLSLGAFAAGLWRMSVAAGIAALCIRELALPYVLVMLLMATLKKSRHEQIGWVAGLLLFTCLFFVHHALVTPHLGHQPRRTAGWSSAALALWP